MIAELIADLNQHESVCRELLALAHSEGVALRNQQYSASAAQFDLGRKNLLPALAKSVERLKQHRVRWQKLPREERAKYPEITARLRQAQDRLMKILNLDRENEQLLLRQGLVPPNQLPPANRHRPHFVANLYSRQGGGK